MKKQRLMDHIFRFGNNSSVWDLKEVQMKIVGYQKMRGKDPQLSDLFIIADIFIIANERGYTDETYTMSRPILNRLRKTKDWDFLDVRIFVAALGFHICSFEQLSFDADSALIKLQEYFYMEQYPMIKLALHMNVTTNLLKLTHFEEEVRNHPENQKRFEDIFIKHINAAMEICKEEGITPATADVMVRKGVFFGDQALIDEAFEMLEKFGDADLLCLLKRSVERYREDEKHIKESRELSAIVGENIKQLRTAHGLSQYRLSESIGVLPSQIGLMELGQKNISVYTLHKIASCLGSSIGRMTEAQ